MIRSAFIRYGIVALLTVSILATVSSAATLWELAHQNKDLLRIATLFTAQNVRDHLGNEEGIDQAIDWCKATGITHVFIETFRSEYTVPRPLLERAKARFTEAGFDVSGCVTTVRVGKQSTGWDLIDCYTDVPTQEHLQEIFEYTASLFDEIMIDDFLFTDCECEECQAARGDKSWAEYRCDLMVKVSRDRILAPARAVNPNVKIIIKYPQWLDRFHERGYEVVRQSADYDRTWVGTETRDYEDPQWGGCVQYRAYYIMRWLGEIGGAKCGGGWFDPYGTHEDTYVEQARQTVLADAKEMVLFCYGSLQDNTGPANVARFRTELPGLFELAKLVRNQPIQGIAAPKPPNSDAGAESYVYDFVGMMGLPLVPTATLRTDAQAAFLPVQMLKDPQLKAKLAALFESGAPVLLTDGLAAAISLPANADNYSILKVEGNPKRLLGISRESLNVFRRKMLAPFGLRFDAPNKVALCLIGDNIIVENFNDEPVTATLEFAQPHEARQVLSLPADANVQLTATANKVEFQTLPPRTLVALTRP